MEVDVSDVEHDVKEAEREQRLAYLQLEAQPLKSKLCSLLHSLPLLLVSLFARWLVLLGLCGSSHSPSAALSTPPCVALQLSRDPRAVRSLRPRRSEAGV